MKSVHEFLCNTQLFAAISGHKLKQSQFSTSRKFPNVPQAIHV